MLQIVSFCTFFGYKYVKKKKKSTIFLIVAAFIKKKLNIMIYKLSLNKRVISFASLSFKYIA